MAGMSAFGTLLKRTNADSPETFTSIANVTNIEGPALTVDFIDVTSHDSSGGFEEFVAGIKRGGEITITGNFDPASTSTHDDVLDDLDAGSEKNYQLVFPTSPTTTWTFACYVTEFSPSAPHDGKLEFTAKFKLTGAVTRP